VQDSGRAEVGHGDLGEQVRLSALDVSIRAQIVNLLQDLKRRKGAVA
jgi:hypothetical protein